MKRAIVLKNPVVDFDKVLLVDMPYPARLRVAARNAAPPGLHGRARRAAAGARRAVAATASCTQLMPQAPLHGSFWRPDLSFDGQQVLFCFKPHNEKSFHLYEINVDGTGLVQLTDGPFDDLDPIYLPDGAHRLLHHARPHLRPLHAADQRLRAGPLRRATARTSTSSRTTTSRTTCRR